MKIFGWIVLGILVIGIPIFMIWWNAKGTIKQYQAMGEYDTPVLGRLFKN